MFVAVWPDESTRRGLSLLGLQPTRGLSVVRPEQWHVTLRFLGDVHEDLAPALVAALESAARGIDGPVHCEVGPHTAWFGAARVLQIPVAGLDDAAKAIRAATVTIVPETAHGQPPFAGHLTIARSKSHGREAPARAALTGMPFAASFDVDSFDLVASQPGARGHRYTTVARLTLRE